MTTCNHSLYSDFWIVLLMYQHKHFALKKNDKGKVLKQIPKYFEMHHNDSQSSIWFMHYPGPGTIAIKDFIPADGINFAVGDDIPWFDLSGHFQFYTPQR